MNDIEIAKWNRSENFKNLGIDEVYCVAVNDAFVIRHVR